ncbi:MAG: tail fiber domain-containing protein [Agriterribacter sp.]
MKSKLYALSVLLQLVLFYNLAVGQANTALSNLANPTSVNRDLLPNPTNGLNLGDGLHNWKNIYMGTSYFLKNFRIIHAPGTTNFFVDRTAGNVTLTGISNTTLGDSTLTLVTTGGSNTAIGYKTMRRTTTGGGNTVTGFTALYNNITGSNNTAAGYATLYQNTGGSYNNALGYTALFSNTNGYYNIAIGYQAMFSNLNGASNIAIGQGALFTNTSEASIVAIGYRALYNSNGGYSNVAIGTSAMAGTTTGKYNTSVGSGSMESNNTGLYNTVLGYRALNGSVIQDRNVAIGAEALYTNLGTPAGGGNTAVGYRAGLGTSALSTFIGHQTGGPSASIANSTAIGAGTQVTASNQVRIGNSFVSSIGGTVGWSIVSDSRFKKDVKENVPGLSFINQLRPVTYHFDPEAFNIMMKASFPDAPNEISEVERNGIAEKSKTTYTGFIAQEVEAVAKKMNYDFSGIDAPKNDKDYYSLRYSDFVVPMIKGMQELSKKNDSLKIENENLKAQNVLFEERLKKIESILKLKSSSVLSLSGASLEQNTPNPFRGNTTINYKISRENSNAQIVVYDAAGKTLKQYNISPDENGMLRIDAATLPSGTYHYTLFVDGKIVDTKKMVLIK